VTSIAASLLTNLEALNVLTPAKGHLGSLYTHSVVIGPVSPAVSYPSLNNNVAYL
jgi:hypothetical protein